MASLASSSVFVSSIVLLLGLVNITMVSASCATCPITHPQQKFCQAAFVYKVRTISMKYIDINDQPVLYSSQAYDVQYKVKVENVFKGEGSLGKEGQTVFIYSPKNVCNIDKLEMGIRYLVSGNIKGDKKQVTTCGIVEKWSDISASQRRGVRGFYKTQCSSCTVYGTSTRLYYGGKEIVDSMSSGLWSRQQCFFNPLASMTYGSEDCETEHAYCMRQENGACTWEGGKAYDNCFRQREYNWQLMQFGEMGLAAWTCPEQCKTLTPRKLKYKCKKATRKMPPCNSGDTVREFIPDAVRTVVPEMSEVHTVQPNSLQEIPRTVNPNLIQEVPATGSPTVANVLSALLHED